MDSRASTVELIQSRDADGSEGLAILRAQTAVFKRRLDASRSYRTRRGVMWVAIAVLLTVLFAGERLDLFARVSPALVIGAACILLAVILRLWMRSYYRACAEVYRELYRADRRFRIADDGLQITEPSGLSGSIPWGAIHDVANSKDLLVIYLSSVHAFALPKAAVKGQDTEGFCTALERRWRESGAPRPAA